jgi:beta-phosphoglucomutase
MNTYAVIFDVDGVLVNSYRPHLESWQLASRNRGLEMSEPDFARTFGRVGPEVVRLLWPDRFAEESILEFVEEKESIYRDMLREAFPAVDGAPELVADLHAAGFKLALGSSGPPQNVAIVYEKLGGPRYIDGVVSAADVTRGKPDPQVFLLAAGKIGVEPSRCLVIEDAPVGLEAAQRAGMVGIGLTGTAPREMLEARAVKVVTSPRELSPGLIRQLIDAGK